MTRGCSKTPEKQQALALHVGRACAHSILNEGVARLIDIPSLIDGRARVSERRNVEWGIWSRQPSEMGCCFQVSVGSVLSPGRCA